MKIAKGIVSGLIVVAVVLAIVAPVGPIPGFFIGGEATATPAEWPDTSKVDEIRLKVGGGIPRVVTIWVVDSAGDLYVVGNNDSGWVQKLGSGGAVEMRMEDKTYALAAESVKSGFEEIWTAYVQKYQADYPDIIASFPPLEEAAKGASMYRLVAR